jgi:hypothetical protein
VRSVPIARKGALVEVHEDDVLVTGFVDRKHLLQAGDRFRAYRRWAGCSRRHELEAGKAARLSFTAETNSAKETPLPPSAISFAQPVSAIFASEEVGVTIGSSAPAGNPSMKLIAIVMLATEQSLEVVCDT